MAEHIKTSDRKQDGVVLLFDTYSKDSRNLHHSFKAADGGCLAVCITDDGFLPEDVTSVYGYFLGEFKDQPGIPGKPRYFNQITVPDYWEISGTNGMGKVHNLNKERARIFYAEPAHKRLVRVVDWYSEDGVVRSSDHYNRYGALYARTIFNAKGQKVNKSYFSADGREVIVENFVTGDIILNLGEEVRIFHTRTEFVVYFFETAGLTRCRLFFNSLSTPFFVSQRLPGDVKRDVLFWQEPEREDIPGNMQVILNGQSNRTIGIMVQKKKAYDKLIALGADRRLVRKLGFVYPFEKENRHRNEALICTNTENVEQCHKLARALPEMHFHIAAITEMSSKLLMMGAYPNVTLYPGVKMNVLDELFQQCDYYLDINHEGEIVDAVNRAFLNNQLIYAFQETLHNADYVAEEHVYPAAESDRLIAAIRAVMADEELLEEELKKQREAAMSEKVERYVRNTNKSVTSIDG